MIYSMNSQNQSIPSMAHTQEYHVVCQQSLYDSMVMMCQKEGNNLFFLFFHYFGIGSLLHMDAELLVASEKFSVKCSTRCKMSWVRIPIIAVAQHNLQTKFSNFVSVCESFDSY